MLWATPARSGAERPRGAPTGQRFSRFSALRMWTIMQPLGEGQDPPPCIHPWTPCGWVCIISLSPELRNNHTPLHTLVEIQAWFCCVAIIRSRTTISPLSTAWSFPSLHPNITQVTKLIPMFLYYLVSSIRIVIIILFVFDCCFTAFANKKWTCFIYKIFRRIHVAARNLFFKFLPSWWCQIVKLLCHSLLLSSCCVFKFAACLFCYLCV